MSSTDGEGIDVWRGQQPGGVAGVVCTVDAYKRNAELKVLLSCTEEEIADIEAFYRPAPRRPCCTARSG